MKQMMSVILASLLAMSGFGTGGMPAPSADQLRAEVTRYLHTGKAKEAQPLAYRLRDVARRDHAANPSAAAGCLEVCVAAYREVNDFAQAREAAEELRTLWQKMGAGNSDRLYSEKEAEALLLLAEVYAEADDQSRQLWYNSQALLVLEKAKVTDGLILAYAYSAVAEDIAVSGDVPLALFFREKAAKLLEPVKHVRPEITARIHFRFAVLLSIPQLGLPTQKTSDLKDGNHFIALAWQYYEKKRPLLRPEITMLGKLVIVYNNNRDLEAVNKDHEITAIGADLLSVGVSCNAATPPNLAFQAFRLRKAAPEANQTSNSIRYSFKCTNILMGCFPVNATTIPNLAYQVFRLSTTVPEPLKCYVTQSRKTGIDFLFPLLDERRIQSGIAFAGLWTTGSQAGLSFPFLAGYRLSRFSSIAAKPRIPFDSEPEALLRKLLGGYLVNEGKYYEAIEQLRLALRAAEGNPMEGRLPAPARVRVFVRHDLAWLLALNPNTTEEAFALFKKSADELLDYLNATLPYLDDNRRIRLLRHLQDPLAAYISMAVDRGHSPDSIYPYVAAWKELSFTHALGEIALRAEVGNEIKALAEKVVTASQEYNAWKRTHPELRPGMIEEYGKLLLEKERAAAALRFAIFDFGRVAPAQRPDLPARLTTAAVSHALPTDTHFIDYFGYTHTTFPKKIGERARTETQQLAFVLSWGRPAVLVRIPNAGMVAQEIGRWREGIERNPLAPEKEIREIARNIDELLWKPLLAKPETASLASCKRVIVSPDGLLWRFSFGALPGRDAGSRYLIEDVCFSYTLSARHLLRRPVQTGVPPSSMLVIGAPSYADDFAKKHDTLPNSNEAAAQLSATFQRHFPKLKPILLTGGQVNTRSVLGAMRKHRIVCLEMHGPEDPSEQGEIDAFNQRLELSSGEELSLECLPLMLITNLEFFEFWACSVNAGKITNGQGVVAFPRALSQLGCRSVLFTMWQVNVLHFRDVDGKSNQYKLRDQFHDNLWGKKMDKAKALQEAQKAIIHRGGDNRHPQVWASWAILGDTSPLDLPGSSPSDVRAQGVWLIALVLISILILIVLGIRLSLWIRSCILGSLKK